MFGPKCWDVVTGEFVGDCQILDRLIKELLAQSFAEKGNSGWHSFTAQNYNHTAEGSITDYTLVLRLF